MRSNKNEYAMRINCRATVLRQSFEDLNSDQNSDEQIAQEMSEAVESAVEGIIGTGMQDRLRQLGIGENADGDILLKLNIRIKG